MQSNLLIVVFFDSLVHSVRCLLVEVSKRLSAGYTEHYNCILQEISRVVLPVEKFHPILQETAVFLSNLQFKKFHIYE